MESFPVVVFPDVEALVCGFLRSRLDPAVLVGASWPEHIETAAATGVVAVTRGGGSTELDFVLEDVDIDVDVLATDKAHAHDLMQQARAHLLTLPTAGLAGARVYRVRDMHGLTWMPDPVTELPRYVATFEVRVRPA